MSKVSSIIFFISSIIVNVFIFIVDHNPQDIKPSIVKWLKLLEVNEKNIPSFLYSIYSTEQILYFYYIHKILILVPIFILTKFIYNKVKNYYTFKSLYYWLLKFILNIQDIKKPVFISLHDGIAIIVEQLDVQQLWKDYKFNDYTIYPDLKYKRCSIAVELFIIFTLIKEEKLILYAHKIIDNGHNRINTTHLSLQRIPKRFFTICDIYSENRWIDNYRTIRNIHGEYEYTNVSMKSIELDKFIKEHKSRNILTSKHIT